MGYEIRAIDAQTVKELLEGDDAGRRPRVFVTEEEGAPLRCCLTRAGVGERIALLSYAPLRRWAAERGVDPGAYDEQGPIFVHAGECSGAGSGWPEGHTSHRMLRVYAPDGHILRGRYLAADEDPDPALREVFEDQEAAVVHVRAIEFGCFHFEVRRS